MSRASRLNILLTLMAFLMPLLVGNALFAGDLDNVRGSAKGSNSKKATATDDDGDDDDRPKKKRKRRRHNDYCDDEDDAIVSFSGMIFFYAVASPWIVPPAMLGDDYADVVQFSDFPYDNGHNGFLELVTLDETAQNTNSFRLTTEYGTDFSGLERFGGRLQLDNISRLGLDTEWNYWQEDVTGSRHDTLWTGDANLVFRFAQNEHAQFYTGLGLNWLSGGQTDVGFNFTYGFDWFPTEPFVIRSVLDAGTIGGADLYHSKTTLGLVYEHVEIFTGYDILHIGDTNLQGLIGGVTFWW